MKNFENELKEMMVEAYIKVYGEAKWIGLTNEEKNMVLHILLTDICRSMEII